MDVPNKISSSKTYLFILFGGNKHFVEAVEWTLEEEKAKISIIKLKKNHDQAITILNAYTRMETIHFLVFFINLSYVAFQVKT